MQLTETQLVIVKLAMKQILIIYLFLSIGFGTRLNAQPVNLVPNHSFEFLDTCTSNGSLFNYLQSWFNPTAGTPDAFNQCSVNWNVPYAGGYQKAKSGVGFAAIFVYANIAGGGREYIEVKLNDSLVSNKVYLLEFYVNVNNSYFESYSTIGCIGMSLSKVKLINTNSNYIIPNIYPVLYRSCEDPILDTMNWTKVSRFYTALGGEKYLTIGNFFTDDQITWYGENTFFDPKTGAQYFFIDDVGVYEVPDTIIDVPIINLPTAFSPNADGKNDEFKLLGTPQNISNLTFCIFNRWGERIFCNTNFYNGWDGSYKGEPCEIGSYVYTLSYTNTQTGKVEYKRGSVTLVR
jgi:gliding motility-associated-like protein